MWYFLALLLLIINIGASAIPSADHVRVKVLLGEYDPATPDSITLSSPHGLMVTIGNRSKKSYYFKHSVTLGIERDGIRVQKKQLLHNVPLRIRPIDGYIKYNKEDFCGTFYLLPHENQMLLINTL